MNSPDESLKFWFSAAVKPYHFRSTPAFDILLREKFLKLWEQAKEHQLDEWMESKEGCLALTIILDQFPLNMFRGQVESFSTEQQSREVAAHAIRLGYDELLADDQRGFLYLPFMHSESLLDQDYSVALFEKAGMSENLKWAKHHREIVRRFGRFPHRNNILGRESSSEELAYLNSDEAFHG